MSFRTLFMSCVLVAALPLSRVDAQETQPNAATDSTEDKDAQSDDLEQLRELRESLTEAVLSGDVEKQIQHVREDVVTIWQNNQVAIGHDGLRDLLSQINPDGESIFQGYSELPASESVAILPGGNVAIAHGKSIPHYKWLGLEFDLENRWSATLVKSEGQWKLANYHVSGNLIDNPVIDAAKQSVYLAAGAALLIGLTLGALGAKFLPKRRGPESA